MVIRFQVIVMIIELNKYQTVVNIEGSWENGLCLFTADTAVLKKQFPVIARLC